MDRPSGSSPVSSSEKLEKPLIGANPTPTDANALSDDVAVCIIAHLLVQCKIPLSAIARGLRLPPLVVEECIRNRRSSPIVQQKLRSWLQEEARSFVSDETRPGTHEGLASRVPADWIQRLNAALVTHRGDGGSSTVDSSSLCSSLEDDSTFDPSLPPYSSHSSRRAGSLGTADDQAYFPPTSAATLLSGSRAGGYLDVLDPVGKQRFSTLSNKVGQSVMSIFNSPPSSNMEDSSGNALSSWRGWLEERLYDAFDYQGPTPSPTTTTTSAHSGVAVGAGSPHPSALLQAAGVGNADLLAVTQPQQLSPTEATPASSIPGANRNAPLTPFTSENSSKELLEEYAGTLDVNEYIGVVSPAFNANRLLAQHQGRVFFSGAREGTQAAAETTSSLTRRLAALNTNESDVDPLLPSCVPASWYTSTYDVANEIRSLDPGHHHVEAAPPADATVETGRVVSASITTGGAALPRAGTVVKGVVKTRTAEGKVGEARTGRAEAPSGSYIPPPPKLPGLVKLRGSFDSTAAMIDTREKELRVWESAVEAALLRHVESRTEQFFSASQQLGTLHGEVNAAHAAVGEATKITFQSGRSLVNGFLEVGRLHRRRRHLMSLKGLLCTTVRLLEFIVHAENWVRLPERDVEEVGPLVQRICELEAFFASEDWEKGSPQVSGDVSKRRECYGGGRLRCASEWPIRLAAVKLRFRNLLEDYLVQILSSQRSSEAEKEPTPQQEAQSAPVYSTTAAFGITVAAFHVNCLKRAVERYREEHVMVELRRSAGNVLLHQLLNSGEVQDDVVGIVLEATQADQTAEYRKAFSTLGPVSFSLFFSVLSEVGQSIQDQLSTGVRDWAFFHTGVITPLAQSSGEEEQEDMEMLVSAAQATGQEYVGKLLLEAELIVTMLLDAKRSTKGQAKAGEQQNQVLGLRSTEVERVAAFTYQTIEQFRLILRQVDFLWESSSGEGKDGEATRSMRAGSSAGELLRPTVVQMLIDDFRQRHNKSMYQLKSSIMQGGGDAWKAVEQVPTSVQSQLDWLSSCDEESTERFFEKSLEPSGDEVEGAMSATGLGDSIGSSRKRKGRRIPDLTGKKTLEDDKLFCVETQKIFLPSFIPSGEGEVRAIRSPMTEMLNAFERASSSGPRDDGRIVFPGLLRLIADLHAYDIHLAKFPSLGYIIVPLMFELMEQHVSLVGDLILDGRAVPEKLLTHITPVHLLLASQGYAFLVDFIPLLQAHLILGLGLDAFAAPSFSSPIISRGGSPIQHPSIDRRVLAASPPIQAPPAPTSPPGELSRPRQVALRFLTGQFTTFCRSCEQRWKDCFILVIRLMRGSFGKSSAILAALTKPVSIPSTDSAVRPSGRSLGGSTTVNKAVEGEGAGGNESVTTLKTASWGPAGHEWMMKALKELAKLIRTARPLVRTAEMHLILIPLVCEFSKRFREVTSSIWKQSGHGRLVSSSPILKKDEGPESERTTDGGSEAPKAVLPAAQTEDESVVELREDVLLYVANIEKFGYDVLLCAKMSHIDELFKDPYTINWSPCSPQKEILSYFLPTE